MAGRPGAGEARAAGNIETLRSGALRVRVYAGRDPVTKRRHTLTEIIEPGPKAMRKAEAAKIRLLSDVAERRNPRTGATVDQLLDRYLHQFDGSPNTLTLYRGYVRNHISPFLGRLKVGALDADVLDSFYAELRRCRHHCSGSRSIQHRVKDPHECDDRCGPHRCRPLGASTVRHMHFILSGAYKRAVRWRWVSVSPIGQAEPPAAPKPNPQPPTAEHAARIINEAWRDLDWGVLLWVAMTTGARRGELCAVRWSAVNLDEGRETIALRQAIRKSKGGHGWVEAELKTHQQRRVAIDPETAEVLRKHRERCRARANALGIKLDPEAFAFSGVPDGAEFPIPDSVTQRYERLANRLGIVTTFHKLRHYSATELIIAGVDIRTVAGRLGHAGGGTTTLRTYVAWSSEADQRAATGLATRMPQQPVEVEPRERARTEPRHPYEKVAAAIERRIQGGELRPGSVGPTAVELAETHGVSVATARRAVALAKEWGVLINDSDALPRVAVRAAASSNPPSEAEPATADVSSVEPWQMWSVTLRGPAVMSSVPRLVRASLDDPDTFRPHLIGIARIDAPKFTDDGDGWVSGYELEVRKPDEDEGRAIILRWQ